METEFTENDLLEFQNKGITTDTLNKHIFFLQNGVQKINCYKCAVENDGIWVFSDDDKNNYAAFFDANKHSFLIQKFVPASGAATRMFQFLIEFIATYNPETETINSYINTNKCSELSIFLVGLKNFPFYLDLLNVTKKTYTEFGLKQLDKQTYLLIKTLLEDPNFDFANKPKGVLPFHKKRDSIETPVHKHLNEVVYYESKGAKPQIHFTISKEHQPLFESITNSFESIDVSYSYQEEKTDTIALHLDNSIFRLPNNELYFRPAGHGALIENLNALESDIIFIKNIDNVAQNNNEIIYQSKKILGGVLMQIQKETFAFLNDLDQNEISSPVIAKALEFVTRKLNSIVPENFNLFKKSNQIAFLKSVLNRPIRVCGMVKNEGEPGGGPFWVKHQDGAVSLQIVETSQIDLTNESQVKISKTATHFNPVNMVCGIKNYHGEKFNLLDFVDENTGFIVEKSYNGTVVKAYELPGLWNGAMAKWNTIFVEVPLLTFNPVKNVNDLLKPAHQEIN